MTENTRLVVKTGEYTNRDGETKGEYTRIGLRRTHSDGNGYLLLDPCVSLAGCLAKQRAYDHSKGKPMRDMLLVSEFSDEQKSKHQVAPQKSEQFNDDIPF